MVGPSMKQKLYIVFDKMPIRASGGLVATYETFVQLMGGEFDIELVEVFSNPEADIEAFKRLPIHTLSQCAIDDRFFRAFLYAKRKQFKRAFWALWSALWFFLFIPIARVKTNKLLKNTHVIAASPAAAIFLGSKVRFIQEIHTGYEYFFGNNPRGSMQAKLMAKPALTVFRNKADANKAISHFPATYIYNCVIAEESSSPYPLKALTHKAVYVGRLEEQKDPMRLLECAKQMKEYMPDFKLDIYGGGSMLPEVEKAICNMGLQNTVSLKGFVTNKAITRGYDVLWLVSRVEGFGLVLIEAASNMTPTISVNWGPAVQEVILDGQSGYVVESNEELVNRTIKLMSNLDERNRLAENALKHYQENFTARNYVERWKQILKEAYPEKID